MAVPPVCATAVHAKTNIAANTLAIRLLDRVILVILSKSGVAFFMG